MTRNSGLCIGGPRDGDLVVWYAPHFQAVERPKLSIFDFDTRSPAHITSSVTVREYRFLPMRIGEHNRGLWGCDGWTDIEAFDQLLSSHKDITMAKSDKSYCSDFRNGGPTNAGEQMKGAKGMDKVLMAAAESDQKKGPVFSAAKSEPVKAAAKKMPE